MGKLLWRSPGKRIVWEVWETGEDSVYEVTCNIPSAKYLARRGKGTCYLKINQIEGDVTSSVPRYVKNALYNIIKGNPVTIPDRKRGIVFQTIINGDIAVNETEIDVEGEEYIVTSISEVLPMENGGMIVSGTASKLKYTRNS
ncbi:hypothetical protein D1872_178390 [compost metagenome]